MPSKKPRKSRKSSKGPSSYVDELETDPTKGGGFILAILGFLFAYALVNSPWDFFNTIPKLIGIIVCLFAMFGGILLLLPEKHRPAATEALVKGFTLTLQAVVSLGKTMGEQIAEWEKRRRLRKEREESAQAREKPLSE